MYIVFEGIDGSGKTTLSCQVCEALRKLNFAPIRLQEPSYGEFGLQIREKIATGEGLNLETQRRLLTLDRRDHLKSKVEPALAFVRSHSSFILVQDRCYLSAPAYQARDAGEVLKLLADQQAFAPKPNTIFLLDLPVETAIKRIERSRENKTLFEDIATLERVRTRYLQLARDANENIELLDATEEIPVLCEYVLGKIELR